MPREELRRQNLELSACGHRLDLVGLNSRVAKNGDPPDGKVKAVCHSELAGAKESDTITGRR